MHTHGWRGLRLLAGIAATAAAGCLTAGPALADGPCGQDYSSQSACAINSASAPDYSGSIVANDDTDYYVFYAQADTRLSLSLTDIEDPSCSGSSSDTSCGSVSFALVDSQDNTIISDESNDSAPSGGISIPDTDTTILQSAGTYYLEVDGDEGSDQYGNPTDVPYTLQVAGSPAVVWPAPATTTSNSGSSTHAGPTAAPRCQVPAVRRRRLVAVERELKADHCTVGIIRERDDRHVGRGRVIRLSSPAGSTFVAGHRIAITISEGPRRRHA